MTMFIDPYLKENRVCFQIFGEKIGKVVADDIGDACYKLLKHLTKDDVAYIDRHGIGAAVVDSLSHYINVVEIMPSRKCIISAA